MLKSKDLRIVFAGAFISSLGLAGCASTPYQDQAVVDETVLQVIDGVNLAEAYDPEFAIVERNFDQFALFDDQFSSHENFLADNENTDVYFVGGQVLTANDKIAKLDRIDLANIAAAMDVRNVEEETYLPKDHQVHFASARSKTVSSRHEDTLERQSKNQHGRQKHLNHFSYDVHQYSSVAENLPDGWVQGEGKVINQNSGLSCFTRWEAAENDYALTLYRIHQFDQKGLDVGCTYTSNTGGYITNYASYIPGLTLEEHAKLAGNHIATRFKTDKTLPVPVVELKDKNGKKLEEPIAVGFDVTPPNSDVKMKSSLWVVKTGDWHVKTRATHRQDDSVTEIMASLLFSQAHTQVRERNGVALLDDLDV